MKQDQIVIYQTEDGQTQIDVRLENETVWLNVSQMASLFNKEDSNIRRHVLNAFKEGELERDNNNVHFLHVNGVIKPVPYYSLDVIISVGYRVKSKRGTAFRIWARKIIKDYLVKGYAVNERIRKEQIGELRQLVQVVGRTISNHELPNTSESQDLLDVVVDYTYTLDTLDNYDYERLSIDKTTKEEPFHATYENAMEAINGLREKFGGFALFGSISPFGDFVRFLHALTLSRNDKKGKALSRLKHLNTSLFGAESLCGKGVEAFEYKRDFCVLERRSNIAHPKRSSAMTS